MNSSSFEPRLADLLKRLDTDPAARGLVIELAAERLRQLARRIMGPTDRVGRWETSDDVAQGAAVRLIRALSTVRPTDPRGFINLCAVMIQRELRDLARTRFGIRGPGHCHTSPSPDSPADPGFHDPCSLEPLQHLELIDLIHRLPCSPPASHREIARLHLVLDLDLPSVATQLNTSLSTVNRRYREAKILLAGLLKERRSRA